MVFIYSQSLIISSVVKYWSWPQTELKKHHYDIDNGNIIIAIISIIIIIIFPIIIFIIINIIIILISIAIVPHHLQQWLCCIQSIHHQTAAKETGKWRYLNLITSLGCQKIKPIQLIHYPGTSECITKLKINELCNDSVILNKSKWGNCIFKLKT